MCIPTASSANWSNGCTVDRSLRLGMAASAGMRTRRIVRNYEEVLAHYQGNSWVLTSIDRMAEKEGIPAAVAEEVHSRYRHWHDLARAELDSVGAQFPEFITAMQERLSQRVALLAEQEATKAQMEHGLLPQGIGEARISEVFRQLNTLRTPERTRLRVSPEELLRKVPFFQKLSRTDFAEITLSNNMAGGKRRHGHSGAGDALYLIARGVVRVLRNEEDGDGEEHALGTLLAGDFFGEQALLHGEPRNATCRAVTPCYLYQLHRNDFEELCSRWPAIYAAVCETDRARIA
jgi:CPA1 family monovalent cation:H+ antiporter